MPRRGLRWGALQNIKLQEGYLITSYRNFGYLLPKIVGLTHILRCQKEG